MRPTATVSANDPPLELPVEHSLEPPIDAARAFVDELIDYYEEAGPDYAAWSANFNMHFGYFAAGMNPFRREPMLARMNQIVFDQLDFDDQAGEILDAGCGLGTPARAATLRFAKARTTGVSIVPWQIKQAQIFSAGPEYAERLRFLEADYCRTGLPDASFDRVYGIESVCHGPGLSKSAFLTEAARLLKPGGRLVVADGFLKQSHRPLRWPLNTITRKICECWSLETFADLFEFQRALHDAGFRDVQITDISWRIAPSVLHVPVVTAAFLWQQIRAGTRLSRQRKKNLIAPMLAPLLGLARSRFAYCLVSAVRI